MHTTQCLVCNGVDFEPEKVRRDREMAQLKMVAKIIDHRMKMQALGALVAIAFLCFLGVIAVSIVLQAIGVPVW